MTDRTSDTPLDREILRIRADIIQELRLLHRIRNMIRDASTNCEISGYREFPIKSGKAEWELRQDDKVIRLILIELP